MDDLAALARVSAELGRNRLLVQAAGGNTSVKDDGVLWVKASGTLARQGARRTDLRRARSAPPDRRDGARRSGLRDLRRVRARRSLRPRSASLGRDDAARRPAAALRPPRALRRDDRQRGPRRRRGPHRAAARRPQMAMGSLYASRLSVVPDDYAGRRRLRLRQSRAGGRRRHARGGRRLARDRRAAAGAPDSGRPEPALRAASSAPAIASPTRRR